MASTASRRRSLLQMVFIGLGVVKMTGGCHGVCEWCREIDDCAGFEKFEGPFSCSTGFFSFRPVLHQSVSVNQLAALCYAEKKIVKIDKNRLTL